MTDAFNLSGGSDAERLRTIWANLVRLDEEQQAIAAEKRDALKEAKKAGYVPHVLTVMVRRHRKDPAAIAEGDALLDTYEAITGTGAGAAGTLQMKRNDQGVFEAKMVHGGGAEVEEKLSRDAKARRAAVTMAELARLAREGDAP